MNDKNNKMEDSENLKDFKELTVEELFHGYAENEDGNFVCIFCGEEFEAGVIYQRDGKFFTAEREALEHVKSQHGGSFHALVNLDKQICGLSDIQKNLLTNMYEQNDNKTICENMGISPATVRTHKFNLQKAKREAKILLSLIEIVEDEKLLQKTKPQKEAEKKEEKVDAMFNVNSLHPFFTQFKHSGRL